MGAQSSNHQWLKRTTLLLALLSLCLISACKHRRGPSVPEEWDQAGSQANPTNLQDQLNQAKGLRILELFEDGFVTTDTATFRLDLQQNSAQVERRYDPVPFTAEEPLLIQNRSDWPVSMQKTFLSRLATASVRQVPRCNSYATMDGGYGGRLLIIIDHAGREHSMGSSDAPCAASDHECSGNCLSLAVMNQVFEDLIAMLPIPEKPQTVFSCASDSPLPCAQKETVIFGTWQGQALRADVRRVLATRLCDLAAFALDPGNDGHWVVLNSSRERVGTVRIDSQNRTVACLTR